MDFSVFLRIANTLVTSNPSARVSFHKHLPISFIIDQYEYDFKPVSNSRSRKQQPWISK